MIKRLFAIICAILISLSLFACDSSPIETTGAAATTSIKEKTSSATEKVTTSATEEVTTSAEENVTTETESVATETESIANETESETETAIPETETTLPMIYETTEAQVIETEPPHVHDFVETKNTATCTEGGKSTRKCECGETEVVDSQPLDHNYKTTEKVKPGCVEPGYAKYECTKCSDSYKKLIEATANDHKFTLKRVTCGNHAYDAFVCSVCDLEVIEYGNADGSISGGNSSIKFYLTGEPTFENEFYFKNYHLVVYGKGAMPSFMKEPPAWRDYLKECSKITILEGITSISARAFECANPKYNIEFVMADSVRSIMQDAISLKLKTLRLGRGVTAVETFGIDYTLIDSVFWPKSLQKEYSIFGNGAWSGNLKIYYEGDKKEFLKLSILYTDYSTNAPVDKIENMKTVLENYFSHEDAFAPFSVYINATDATPENGDYFDIKSTFKK